MEAKSVNFKQAKGIKSAFLVILCCFILAVCIFHFVLGNPANFMTTTPTTTRCRATCWVLFIRAA